MERKPSGRGFSRDTLLERKMSSGSLERTKSSSALDRKQSAAVLAREIEPNHEFYSDCDSEGRDPPEATFMDPTKLEDEATAPRRTNAEIKLPFFQPRERRRLREMYESKISYEDWVENDPTVVLKAQSGFRQDVRKLEEDSDFPVGRVYFWHAFCHHCHINYHPHVPGMWMCTQCKERVWQQPEDPESKNCAECHRRVAPIRKVKGVVIRNPMSLNAHLCKRCGRVVCDHCYSPATIDLDEFGYTAPQHVCTKCSTDAKPKAPSEEDIGTLYEENVGGAQETLGFQPFWVPKCSRCNITFARPPKKWLCTSCRNPVWQSLESQDATKCWICTARFPQVRCHKCGQWVCHTCGAYSQPLVELGWEDGFAKSVCKCCFGGIDLLPREIAELDEVVPKTTFWKGKCPACSATFNVPPDQWQSKCHMRKVWQPEEAPQSKNCGVCGAAIADGTREHCMKCGRLVCIPCSQYKQPLPERGFAKALGQPICKMCFNPRLAFLPESLDYNWWPPKCQKCGKSWQEPPDRWQCPNQCGLVWQQPDHVASTSCYACGKKVSSPINCRVCGRVVCTQCGQGRAEALERGFTRGVSVPVCSVCLAGRR